MKTKIIRRRHKELAKGVHQVNETSITRGGRIKDSMTITEKLNDKGDLHVVKEETYTKASPAKIKSLLANGTSNKKAESKKKTAAKKSASKKKTSAGTKKRKTTSKARKTTAKKPAAKRTSTSKSRK